MSARTFLLLVEALGTVFVMTLALLSRANRSHPLPLEVEDVYTPKRWNTYVGYASDMARAALVHRVVRFAILAALVLAIPYDAIERWANFNPYVASVATLTIFSIANTCESLRFEWKTTLGIRQRYGLNCQTPRSFLGSYASQRALSFVGLLAVVLLVSFVGEHLRGWTNGFRVSFGQMLVVCMALCLAIEVVLMMQQLVTYLLLRTEYHFQPLPEGDLRDHIARMLSGCSKSVSQVYVYDESSRSTTKNAFLLRVLWHREIGIADNFLNGNSERQLLAVLSHEIGHLKHKAGWREVANALFVLAIALLVAWSITYPQTLVQLARWTRSSFGITSDNYFLLLMVLGAIAYVPSILVEAATNALSRHREAEADLEVVRNGYGEDLIATLKRMAADQLTNVAPHPVVEWATFDHPSLVNRIRNIRAAEAKLAEELIRNMNFDEPDDNLADNWTTVEGAAVSEVATDRAAAEGFGIAAPSDAAPKHDSPPRASKAGVGEPRTSSDDTTEGRGSALAQGYAALSDLTSRKKR